MCYFYINSRKMLTIVEVPSLLYVGKLLQEFGVAAEEQDSLCQIPCAKSEGCTDIRVSHFHSHSLIHKSTIILILPVRTLQVAFYVNIYNII